MYKEIKIVNNNYIDTKFITLPSIRVLHHYLEWK